MCEAISNKTRVFMYIFKVYFQCPYVLVPKSYRQEYLYDYGLPFRPWSSHTSLPRLTC